MNKILKLILVFFNLSKKYTDSAVAHAGVQSDTVDTIWTGTQAQYDAIDQKDDSTLYFIEEE